MKLISTLALQISSYMFVIWGAFLLGKGPGFIAMGIACGTIAKNIRERF